MLYRSNNPLALCSSTSSLPTTLSTNMMFTRALALTISALPLLAVATPLKARAASDCSTGALQCCDSTETVCNSCLCSPCSTELI